MTLNSLNKLAGTVGNLRELVNALGGFWKESPNQFEAALRESAPSWSRDDLLPLGVQVLITEQDDAKLREVVRGAFESSKTDRSGKETIHLIAALWGDEWARSYMNSLAERVVQSAIRAKSGELGDGIWSLRRCAMAGYWPDREVLARLSSMCEANPPRNPECAGLLEALTLHAREGSGGLVSLLEGCLARKKVSERDIAACFILGANGARAHAELFLKLFRDKHRTDWWTENLRGRALESFAYVTHLDVALQQVIEDRITELRRSLTKRSWLSGSHTPEFLGICDILWNVHDTLRPNIVDTLQAVAAGLRKDDAAKATSLLMLKGVNCPFNSAFGPEDFKVKAAKDFLQYDSGLNFAYYWRCKKGCD